MPAHSALNSNVQTATRSADDSVAAKQAAGVSASKRMLDEVLGETLLRRQECSEELLRVLARWRSQLGRDELAEDDFPILIREVLAYRLSAKAKKLPDDLFQEVGGALWAHEASRERVFQLWQSLEAGR